MQPTAHMSTAALYVSHESSSSGARYQRVTTYSVMNALDSLQARARPKSQILRSQVAFSSRLLGLRSRCSTLAVWTYLSPRRISGGKGVGYGQFLGDGRQSGSRISMEAAGQ